MKENNESKARFFALYYGQSVLKWHDKAPIMFVSWEALDDHKNPSYGIDFSKHHLSLFDISSLTDEQAIEVAKIAGIASPFTTVTTGRLIAHDLMLPNKRSGATTIAVYQCLLSQSIAFPFYCSTEERVIEVKEMIEMGWIKIKTI